MSERKLATIRRIDSIVPIENADRIEQINIGGWKVISQKGLYKEGGLVVYLEIDSWVPDSVAPFLTQEGHFPKEYNGIQGQRLRTKKLRGVISQGLLLPFEGDLRSVEIKEWTIKQLFPESQCDWVRENKQFEGADVTDVFGITKWEPPATGTQGQSRGNFPHFIRKTDQERCQNLRYEIFDKHAGERFEVTVKLDGSSMTVYKRSEDQILEGLGLQEVTELGVCSRNLNLKLDDNEGRFVKTAKESGLLDIMEKFELNYAIQGELMGPAVQGNREGFDDFRYYVYDIWDINSQKYLAPPERNQLYGVIAEDAKIYHAPVLYHSVTLEELGIQNIDDLLAFAEGPSINHKVREGVVFKSLDSDFTFKAISNKFLLTGGD